MLSALNSWLAGIPPPLALAYPPGWTALRDELIEEHPYCSACGGTTHLQTHHIKSVSDYPKLALVRDNCIVLCMAPGHLCHFIFGHLRRWDLTSPHVREDAAAHLLRTQQVHGRLSVRLTQLMPEPASLERVQRRLHGLEERQAAEIAKRDTMIRRHVAEIDRLMFEVAASMAREGELRAKLPPPIMPIIARPWPEDDRGGAA